MQELVAVLFATPAGNALDDDKCPGDDGHADQYGQNGFAQKIALGNENPMLLTVDSMVCCFLVFGKKVLSVIQVEAVRDDGPGVYRPSMFHIGVKSAAPGCFQGRFIEPVES